MECDHFEVCASIWRLFLLIIMILSTSDTISSLSVKFGHSPLMKILACWCVGLLKTTRKLRQKSFCHRSVRCTGSWPLMQMDWEWNTTGMLRGLAQGLLILPPCFPLSRYRWGHEAYNWGTLGSSGLCHLDTWNLLIWYQNHKAHWWTE